MTCKIRKWKLSDAKDLAMALSNRKIQDNLRDGLPYPYTEQDGLDYISSMISADENETFAITVDDKVVGSIGIFRQENIHRQTAELMLFAIGYHSFFCFVLTVNKVLYWRIALNKGGTKAQSSFTDEQFQAFLTTAITIFCTKVAQERRIPFEITADPDPFYSESNIRYLEKKMEDYKAGRLKLAEHELIEE